MSAAKNLFFLLSALFGFLAAHTARAQSVASSTATTDKTVEQTLFKLEDAFAKAVVKRDVAALSRLVAPKWVYSDETGVMERADGIRTFTTGSDTVREASNARMRALVYGNSAVVIGILQMKGRGPKGPFTNRYRYTDTWTLLDGRWQCVASQDYLMPEPRKNPDRRR